jgi:hypothetical protein
MKVPALSPLIVAILLIDAQLRSPLSARGSLLFLGRLRLLNRQEIDDPRHALVDGRAQGAAMHAPCRLNILQGHDLSRVLLAECTAEEVIR